MNPRLAWPAVVLAAVAMLVAGGMAAVHVETSLIVTVVTVLALPVLTALVALQVGQVQGQVNQLAQQTNGHQSELLEIVRSQGKALATSTPAEPPGPPVDGAEHPPAAAA